VKRFFLYLFPIFAYAGLIFALSSQSQLPTMPSGNFDKVAHFVEFGILAWLLARALMGYDVEARRAFVYSVALGVLYGASDEIHQMYTPQRAPELADLLADTAGAFAGAFSYVGFLGLRKKREPTT
jgi:VanZ family protein